MVKMGIYQYKGKNYLVDSNRVRRGAGEDRGRLFITYHALYDCEGGKDFVRELKDFQSKFELVTDLSGLHKI